ncbi:MAG: thioredoxin family protein [Clostridiales bacterium]|nr:thioredoxin family protein [Clostridiales bacterium]
MNEIRNQIDAEEHSCCCGGGATAEKASETAADTARILVLGAGCPKCRALEQAVKKALEELGVDEPVGHVTDYAEMANYGVMSTPALVIDGKAVSVGRTLNAREAQRLLKEHL